jgi:hypothetical protein
MIRNIRAFGLALFAMLALGAFAASAAQAAPGEVHITTPEKAVITADGTNHILKFGTNEVHCNTGQLEGTLQNGVNGWTQDGTQLTGKHITVTAAYQECTAFGFPMQFVMNGCKYTLDFTAELTAQTEIAECTTGKSIEIKVPALGCTIIIGNQGKYLPHVIFTNNAESETTNTTCKTTPH